MAFATRLGWALGLCLAFGWTSGCGSSSGTLPVTGKVTKGGQPVAGAAVTFVPQGAADAESKPASGTTDASGTYTLTTFVNGDGALPGSYKVKITKFPGAAPAATPAGGANPGEFSAENVDAIYAAMEKQGQNVMAGGGGAAPTVTNELPARFADAETSGLTAEIKAGGTNSFDFDVTGQ